LVLRENVVHRHSKILVCLTYVLSWSSAISYPGWFYLLGQWIGRVEHAFYGLGVPLAFGGGNKVNVMLTGGASVSVGGIRVSVGEGSGVSVSVGTGDSVGVGVSVVVGVGVSVRVAVGEGVTVGVSVSVGVGVFVWVAEGVWLMVGEAVSVHVGEGVIVVVGTARTWGANCTAIRPAQ
jgi:hypothetical protein